MNRKDALLVSILPLVGLLGAAFLLDWFAAVSINPLFLGVVAALGLLAAVVAGFRSRRAGCLLPLLPFMVVLAFLPRIDLSPLKPFARFYAAIESGMTEMEVLRALETQFPREGRYRRPFVNRRLGQTHLGFILDPKDGRYDTEIVALELEDGRVVSKRYYAD